MDSQSKVLIVTAHPDPDSLTVAVAQTIGSTISDGGHDVVFQNLTEINFWPAFTAEDLAAYRDFAAGRPPRLPEDVLEQQHLLASSDALVIVFPVYWWSLPAHIKGWLERVFTGGWAYGSDKEKVLERLKVQLVALTASDADLYDRHEYQRSAETQIRHGVFEYCGIRDVDITWLWGAERQPEAALDDARASSCFLGPDVLQLHSWARCAQREVM